MQLIRGGINHFTRRLPQCVATIGNFDGFHRGHQKLLDLLREKAQALQLPAVVITFEPQPQEFFHPQRAVPRLTRFHEKWQVLKEQNIAYLVRLRFNAALAQCSAEDFIENILIAQLGVKAMIVGDDFRFGAGRAGDLSLLQKWGRQYGFETIQAPVYVLEGQRVSSTRVRQLLQAGDLMQANQLLGRSYFLCGKVVHGDARGRRLGFPTANIRLSDGPVAVQGIYVVQVLGLEEKPLPAVASVGVRPMFSNDHLLLEVHLLDFNRDLYGCAIKVEFLHKLRDEQRFPTTEALIVQMQKDVQNTRIFFSGETHYEGTKKTA